jgi:glycosyltransferase involved in cell wall biosynthesis
MKIIIATVHIPFIFGGAEVLAKTLSEACKKRGHEVEIVGIPFKAYPAARILDHMMACRLFDLTEVAEMKVDRLIGLKFPAYLIPHPHKSFWILHQHRSAYDLWDKAESDLLHAHDGNQIRSAIINADNHIFTESPQSIYTISKNVSQRLQKYNGVSSNALYPPPQNAELFYTREEQGYLFFPSRINYYKRQELVLRSIPLTKHPVQVIFGGRPDQQSYGEELFELVRNLGIENRVKFIGEMTEEQKLKLYAESIGIVYPPLDEDYGYVTLEAMLASKPVITCSDSGGPLEFIKHRENGLIADPTPKSLAAAMDELWENREASRKLGSYGREIFQNSNINWDSVLTYLLK